MRSSNIRQGIVTIPIYTAMMIERENHTSHGNREQISRKFAFCLHLLDREERIFFTAPALVVVLQVDTSLEVHDRCRGGL